MVLSTMTNLPKYMEPSLTFTRAFLAMPAFKDFKGLSNLVWEDIAYHTSIVART